MARTGLQTEQLHHRVNDFTDRLTDLRDATRRLQRDHDQASAELERKHANELAGIEAEWTAACDAITTEFAEKHANANGYFDRREHRLMTASAADEQRAHAEYQHQRDKATQKYQHTIWVDTTSWEATVNAAKKRHTEDAKTAATILEQLTACQERTKRAAAPFYRREHGIVDICWQATAADIQLEKFFDEMRSTLTHIDSGLNSLSDLPLVRMCRPFRLMLAIASLTTVHALFASGLYWTVKTLTPVWITGLILVAALFVVAMIHQRAKRQAIGVVKPLWDLLDRAFQLQTQCCAAIDQRLKMEIDAATDQRNASEAAAKATHSATILLLEATLETAIPPIKARTARLEARIKHRRQHIVEALNARQTAELARINSVFPGRLDQQRRQNAQEAAAFADQREAEQRELEQRWRDEAPLAADTINDTIALADRYFPPWDSADWQQWTPTNTFLDAVAFASTTIDMSKMLDTLPEERRHHVSTPTTFNLPATLAFPNQCSLLLRAPAIGRHAALDALQTTMLRLLTSMPPGKVGFTIIDPIGLGDSFAGFMHLADYADNLVGRRIWTETRHIEQQLSDLNERMEQVIQRCLRNEFNSIVEYNDVAKETAEQIQFLVIADFPTNFSALAAQRLASIVASGAKCGVYTLIHWAKRSPLPEVLDLNLLRRRANFLDYIDDHFVWQDGPFSNCPLTVQPRPETALINRILRQIGDSAKDAGRVQVPFAHVMPDNAQIWHGNAAKRIHVGVGRAGANQTQWMSLGEGTAHHVLVAGQTGSGKSTLFHVIITNIALTYSPDEVELYLTDFKKGVEFKSYATQALPHARAIAVESDREFGLSVLQRVDHNLHERGQLFRHHNVQDLAAFRAAVPDHIMPRTLVIIDEFQEFFVNDDAIAQEAALLLDRIVRQGRAFGIHLILGSQTLGGAYALARSTMGQISVRVALQCSEADSFLILDDDNSAARLLSRPGDAIYNDAAGRLEANCPFQVVWLSDDERRRCLQTITELATSRGRGRALSPVVFEGSAPGAVERNDDLDALLQSPPSRPPTPVRAWLGDPNRIKQPTHLSFSRSNGNHVLMVGHQEEAALAMFTTCLFSLAAQYSSDSAQLVIIDGSRAESPHADYLSTVVGKLRDRAQIIPYGNVPATVNTLATELARRMDEDDRDAGPIYLFVYGLHRFRKLRYQDDFGFGDNTSITRPDQQFDQLLRDGADFGIHLLVWCDALTTLTRTLSRRGLDEFGMRVLFQMGATESTALVDTPAASKLGLHHALYCDDHDGTMEKFRPYALPDEQWIAAASERLADHPSSLN